MPAYEVYYHLEHIHTKLCELNTLEKNVQSLNHEHLSIRFDTFILYFEMRYGGKNIQLKIIFVWNLGRLGNMNEETPEESMFIVSAQREKRK